MKIYFAAALANTTEEFRNELLKTRDVIGAKFEVLSFWGYDPVADPKDIYAHDSSCVKNCDILLAECSHASTGVGIEIGQAIAMGKPIIVAAQKGKFISAMIRGNDYPKLKIVYYKDAYDLLEQVSQIIVK